MEGWQSLVYCAGLENQRTVKRSEGSNPSPSPIFKETWQSLVYCIGLLFRRCRKVPAGSNPAVSANNGSVTQLAEYSTDNRVVAGSSPAGATKFLLDISFCFR